MESGGRTSTVDARPSEALIRALLAKMPVWPDEALLTAYELQPRDRREDGAVPHGDGAAEIAEEALRIAHRPWRR